MLKKAVMAVVPTTVVPKLNPIAALISLSCVDAKIANKKSIVDLFNLNVKGKKFSKEGTTHNGAEGQWIERLMNVKPNCNNKPDLLGYEMKKESPTTTFVDKQTSSKSYEGNDFTTKSAKSKESKAIKEKYWHTFARTDSKEERIGGWKLNRFDKDGQCLEVDKDNNINVIYSYDNDKRDDKDERVSDYYKNNDRHIIAQWTKTDLEQTINNKFNDQGFFFCKKASARGLYNKICFGEPINFDYWIGEFKKSNIYYDGYSTVNGRWRGVFRASKTWWNKHITEEY